MIEIPATPIFVQTKNKTKVKIFELLFDRFDDKTHKDKIYKNY